MANYRIVYCSEAHRVTYPGDGSFKAENPDCLLCQRIFGAPAVANRNCQLSEAEKRELTIPFGPRAMKFTKASDVDKRVEAFKQKNPILQEGYKPKSMRNIINEQRKKQ